MRAPKKSLGRPKIVPVGSRIAQGGNSTQKQKTPRSTARFYEVRIRLTRDEFDRGLPYFEHEKYLARFALEAVREKINRAESRDKAGRLKKLLADEEQLYTVLKHMQETGKLNFLFKERTDG